MLGPLRLNPPWRVLSGEKAVVVPDARVNRISVSSSAADRLKHGDPIKCSNRFNKLGLSLAPGGTQNSKTAVQRVFHIKQGLLADDCDQSVTARNHELARPSYDWYEPLSSGHAGQAKRPKAKRTIISRKQSTTFVAEMQRKKRASRSSVTGPLCANTSQISCIVQISISPSTCLDFTAPNLSAGDLAGHRGAPNYPQGRH